jgi:hypothetical protein
MLRDILNILLLNVLYGARKNLGYEDYVRNCTVHDPDDNLQNLNTY